MHDNSHSWPRGLALADWRATHDTLHMWMQIVGKTRLALAPPENHWWHVTLYVSPRGLTTSAIPYGAGAFDAELDFIKHRLRVRTSSGASREILLRSQAVADFYREYIDVLAGLGIALTMRPVPDEVEHPIPFADDRVHATYDPGQVRQFFQMLLQADRVTKRFKGRFFGKSSPVHFFWGAFDLALTRFSGRRAPQSEDASKMMREAMSHEEFSVGFWPGSSTVTEPAFYAYVRPEPAGLAEASVRPAAAVYNRELADFILPYEAARAAARPDDAVLDFYQSAYDAAADLARWDRVALDRPPSEWPDEAAAQGPLEK
jgi:Family of unknown function (DUF5996)